MSLKTAILGVMLGASVLALGGTAASARVVCNREGDCWHTDARYAYPGPGYVYHDDDWYFHHHFDRDHWRDYHEGRGYWRNGAWITF